MAENDAVVEEDWSSHIQDSSLNGFVDHFMENIKLPGGQLMRLKCVTALTPFDMINLYNGHHDATGNRLWMGAQFFACAFNDLEKSIFAQKRVMELGSGTGFSGIALMMLCDQNECAPSQLVLTDADSNSLELCRQNYELNLNNDERVAVRCLDWKDSSSNSQETFDTIIGTDVIYDVGVVTSLLSTVEKYLERDGFFVLSHIPRASLPGESKIASTEEMEKYICVEARKYSLRLRETVRPIDLSKTPKEYLKDISSMQEAGAALLLFVREGSTSKR
jgi:predicted nicotinamide N-methyase